ncbi:glycerophosphoryl diester phosphodiesterase membrane domain-containing protein [Candidatus Palauibacter sp.]|uniref:glycerophosphoryl diester phosphodiesterase membrane domain-containing protein n=1 Tax=Candidatus Palauibacter sp. TaxID=3101350 RepID=UPI003B011E18
MKTGTTDATFRVWRTFRTGLDVARRKALTIIALALVSRFVTFEVISRVTTFSGTFGLELDLAQIERVLVFFGSLLLMWFAVVPLTIQAIEAPPRMEPTGTLLARVWRDGSRPYRALSLSSFLRGLGIVLITSAVVVATWLLSFGFAITAKMVVESSLVTGLALSGLALGLVVGLSVVSLRWSVALPVMIMENVPAGESLRRSWRITKSQVLRLYGLGILTAAVTLILSGLIGYGLDRGASLFSETPGDGVLALALFLGQTVGLFIAAPITSASYYYLRGN